jgi:hypothetical protein
MERLPDASRTTSHKRRLDSTSKPVVGSSRTKNSGLAMKARASASRRDSPPESVPARRFFFASNPNAPSVCATGARVG